MHPIDQKLQQLDIELPEPARPAGEYLPAVNRAGLLFISGQFPVLNGELIYRGQVGNEQDYESGHRAVTLAALNALAHLRNATDHWRQFDSLVRVEGHIASAPGWYDQPQVLDTASNIFNQILGTQGRHTRTAFSPARLPLNATVELVVIAATLLCGDYS